MSASACAPAAPLLAITFTWFCRSCSVYGAAAQKVCSSSRFAGAPPAKLLSCPRPTWRNTSISHSRSCAPAYPAPNSVPDRVAP